MRTILNKSLKIFLNSLVQTKSSMPAPLTAPGSLLLQWQSTMHPLIAQLQRQAARWRVEHRLVAPAATALNLSHARIAAPGVVVVNLLLVVWFGSALATKNLDDRAFEIKLALLLSHLAMALLFGACAWMAHVWRHKAKSVVGAVLPLGMGLLALVFCLTFVALNQPVFAGITTFWIGCMAVAALLYVPPGRSAAIYLAAYALFFVALGWTQTNPTVLHTNRVNALAAVSMGWVVSLLLWRNFTKLKLYQDQLEGVNAELQTRQKELQRLTRLDGLTGLYNRSTFVELTRQELARAQRQGSATSILLLDLDFFKHVNDTWGHPAGDAVLKNVAVVANNAVRSTDLVGRLGGEEFIILLPNTPLDAARKLAEKLRASLERTPTAWQQGHIKSTVSIGVASTTAAEHRDFDHLYTSADQALYSAKEKGRNRVE